MIGLVIVSHSRPLAEGVVNLVKQVAAPNAPIALAAGVGENRQEFGTDATEIIDAVQSVFSPDGVIILMDLGSAVLSAQMALDLLPQEMSTKVRICSAPLVEGAVAAGVQIGLGSPMDMVFSEAVHALIPKQNQLEQGEDLQPAVTIPIQPEEEHVEVMLRNMHGLHARPAARFVQKAGSFKAEITVKDLTNEKGPVSARSLNAIATLGAVEGHRILIGASGEQAGEALQALQALVESAFGEPLAVELEGKRPAVEPPKPLHRPPAEGAVRVVAVSEGFAVGPIYRYEATHPVLSTDPAQDPQAEWERIQAAVKATRDEITRRAQQVKLTLSEAEAAIFEAHLLILEDPDMKDATRRGIFEDGLNAGAAWDRAVNAAAQTYRDLPDTYQQQRAADVEDVGNQVLLNLLGTSTSVPIQFDHPVMLVAEDLTPTETSQLDMKHVLGIITAAGGPTSHSAILARGLGIPAVAGSGMLLHDQPAGSLVGINGFTGDVWINPNAAQQKSIVRQRTEWLQTRESLLQKSAEFARTRDGTRIEVFANIGKPQDTEAALKNGAEGVGLLRTEFLFLTRDTAPTEEEQYQLLRQIFTSMGKERPVTVRTLDVGGDKKLAYINLPEEPNPFLGMRALRLSLAKPELFTPQLRAILRAASGFPCRIMFPMVAGLEEVQSAREWVEKAHKALTDEHTEHAWPAEIGIMVEIPSAALLSPSLIQAVDFFSIGTNDLTQYTLAAERGNPALAYLSDGLNPAVLKLINMVCQNAHRGGKWVGICGELGGDAEAIPILVGLGVDELSMSAPAIPRAKAVIRTMDKKQVEELARQALQAESSGAVRTLVKAFNFDK